MIFLRQATTCAHVGVDGKEGASAEAQMIHIQEPSGAWSKAFGKLFETSKLTFFQSQNPLACIISNDLSVLSIPPIFLPRIFRSNHRWILITGMPSSSSICRKNGSVDHFLGKMRFMMSQGTSDARRNPAKGSQKHPKTCRLWCFLLETPWVFWKTSGTVLVLDHHVTK